MFKGIVFQALCAVIAVFIAAKFGTGWGILVVSLGTIVVLFCLACSSLSQEVSDEIPSRTDMAGAIAQKEEAQYRFTKQNLCDYLRITCIDGNGEEIFRCRGFIDARVTNRLKAEFNDKGWGIAARHSRNGFHEEQTIFTLTRTYLRTLDQVSVCG